MGSFAKHSELDLLAHRLGKMGTFDSALLFESFVRVTHWFEQNSVSMARFGSDQL